MARGARSGGHRVLIVEDDRSIQRLLGDALADEGYEVRPALSGVAALKVLDEWMPDLILLDVTLPEMDGRSFRSQQRGLPSPAADVPVVLVTGMHEHGGLMEELDARALVRKPFDLDELIAVIGELLTRDA